MPVPLLAYASPQTHRSWGPILFVPSRWSMALLLLSAGAFTWLFFRHDPWERTLSIAKPLTGRLASHFNDAAFTTSGNLVIANELGASYFDGRTGREIQRLWSTRQTLTNIGRSSSKNGWWIAPTHMIRVYPNQPVIQIELSDPPKVREFANPIPVDDWILDVAEVDARAVSVARNAAMATIWSFQSGQSLKVPLMDEGAHDRIILTSDAGRAAHLGHDRDADHVLLIYDCNTGQTIREIRENKGWLSWVDHNSRLFVTCTINFAPEPGSPYSSHIQIHDFERGTIVRELVINDLPVHRTRGVLWPDGKTLAIQITSPDGQPRGGVGYPNWFFCDIASGRVFAAPDHRGIEDPFEPLPNSTSFLRHEHELYRIGDSSPSFSFKSKDRLTRPRSSRGGDRVVFETAVGFELWHRVRECRVTPLGIVGQPHAWLLAALSTLLILHLRRDVLRAAGGLAEPSVVLLSLVLVLAAWPRTLWMMLDAAQGRFLLTAAPLVLVAGIMVASGSRFWRLIATIALAAIFASNLYCLNWLRRAGFKVQHQWSVTSLQLDLPNWCVFLGLSAVTPAVAGSLVKLARNSRSGHCV